MRKILFEILACMLVITTLFIQTGCGKRGDTSESEKTSTSEKSSESERSEKMTIFENNTTDYTIIYPDNAQEAEKNAADNISEYVYKVSGVKIPVKQNRFVVYEKKAKIISVGSTGALEKSGITADYSALNGDGFIIKSVENGIFINGATARGTLYGAYEFIERYLGIKFLTYDYEYIPKLDKCEIESPDIVEAPDFRYRNFMIGGYNSNKDFMSKLRFVNEYHTVADKFGSNIGWYKTKDVAANHNSLAYVSMEYAAKHPEFFSMVNGTPVEICQTYGITDDGEIDESVELSPIKIALESLKKFVSESSEDTEYFMFSQQDTQKCCACEKCIAAAEKYTRGGVNVRFVNILAREIQKWADKELNGREIKVVTFAYQYSEEAPVIIDSDGAYKPIDNTVVAADNVYIRMATYFCNNYFSLEDNEQIAKYRTLYKSWSAVTKHFMAWDYHIDYYNYFNYYPTMQTWKENLRLYKKVGVEYLLMQSAQNEKVGWQANLEAYVASKLMWNAGRSVDELTDEFITYYYGAAKDYVKKYKTDYDLYYRALFDRFPDYTLKLGTDRSSAKYYDLSFLLSEEKLMTEVIDKISASDMEESEKTELIRRLKVVRAPTKFMIMYNYNSYYFDDQSGYKAYADEVLSELSSLGFTRYSEGSFLNQFKANNGIA